MNFKIPAKLQDCIEQGLWPASEAEAEDQGPCRYLSIAQLRSFAPDESEIHLFAPPFHKARDFLQCEEASEVLAEWAAADIDQDALLIIADFGLEHETVLALDYSSDNREPRVVRLQWRLPDLPNRWLVVADTFEQFWTGLGSN